MKRPCHDCHVVKPLEDFARDKNRKLGHGYICKPCMSARAKAWAKKNKARAAATGKAWRESNRDRMRISSRKHYAKNATRLRARSKELNARPEAKAAARSEWLRRKYGLTPADWTLMFTIAQQGVCACCRSPDPGSKRGWHTDHDHRTGKVRGIVCHPCNMMFGGARDSVAILELGKAYLKR